VDINEVDRYASVRREKLAEELGIPAHAFIIGHIGRLAAVKGQIHIVRALGKIRIQLPQAHLVLIGEGPARAELEREIVASNMQAHVTLAGQRTDAKRFLRLFDVFVMPSEFEGLGIALLEAMAAGLPCVGTQTGGIPELIKGSGAGLLVPKLDPDALAVAVTTLAKDPERRQKMAQNGRQFVEERYSIDQVYHQYESLYEYLVRQRSRTSLL
jgi:glycosyltransferase involved in cell wall biosynthesis